MRIAFLTPEFISETPNAGGLGNYLGRVTTALSRAGCDTHVFVSTKSESGESRYQGATVHRVEPAAPGIAMRVAARIGRAAMPREPWGSLTIRVRQALGLAQALAREEGRRGPFDAIQSSDFSFPGLFVKKRPNRRHVVRCSSPSDLYEKWDRLDWSGESRIKTFLELAAVRRADAAYAPSRLVAEHYRSRHGVQVTTVRPPLFYDAPPGDHVSMVLPERYLIFFGQIITRKGVRDLAQALELAWRSAPDLTMLWAGVDTFGLMGRFQRDWGARAGQVYYMGPLAKRDLYHAISRAQASVLPSTVDNLPNTVIESLMLGVPVVGTRGSSIDELVEDGVHGALVPIGDRDALAAALLAAWRGELPCGRGFEWSGPVKQEMEPELAIRNLMALLRGEPASGRARGGVGR